VTFSKGWINRQIARVQREEKDWPDWMRREVGLRAEALNASTIRTEARDESQTVQPVVETARGS
jgi:hypothetical protein